MFLITGGMGERGGGGATGPSQVEVTGAGICANQLSIGRGPRCCVQENKRGGGVSERDAVSNSIFKRRGG